MQRPLLPLFCLLFLLLFADASYGQKDPTVRSYNRAKKGHTFSPTELAAVGIDTSKTYKLHSNWLGPYDFDSEERNNYTLLSQAKDIYGGSLTSIEVVQFKGDGTIRFLYPKNQQPLSLSKEDVISQLTGGFDINKEQLHTQRFLGRGHTQQLTKGMAQIIGDTLHLIEKMNGFNMHSQYVVLKSEADH